MLKKVFSKKLPNGVTLFSRNILTGIFAVVVVLMMTGCPTDSDDGGSSSSSSSDNRTTSTTEGVAETGTGTVTGTVETPSTVTITQSDGTTQSTTTSSDYTFEDVPAGESVVTVEDNNGKSTDQTVNVVKDKTTEVSPFGSNQELSGSLSAKVYAIENQNNTRVSDILTDEQLGETLYAKTINVPTRGFEQGFPGVENRFEWFGVIYEGQIKAPKTGNYTFNLMCDDGAVLKLNDNVVVDADGVHGPTEFKGTVYLEEGEVYNFDLRYFQGPRTQICLVVKVAMPDAEEALFNMEDFD